MTEAEKNEIVGLVMTQISSQAVDFDIATEQPQANDLLTAVRQTSPGEYMGVTLKWDDVARIATEVANRAAERAEQAKTDANNILEQVQSKGTEITNFVATSKAEIETQKDESVNAVKSVYQTDLDELKGDIDDLSKDEVISDNLFDNVFDLNGYISASTGEFVSNANFKCTSKFYPISNMKGESYLFAHVKTSKVVGSLAVIFYDENKTFVSFLDCGNHETVGKGISATAKYFKVTTYASYDGRFIVSNKPITESTSYDYVEKRRLVNDAFPNDFVFTDNNFSDDEKAKLDSIDTSVSTYSNIEKVYYVGADCTYKNPISACERWVADGKPNAIMYIEGGEYIIATPTTPDNPYPLQFVDGNIKIIGESKENTILRTTSGKYTHSPIVVKGGNVEIENITFIADHSGNSNFDYSETSTGLNGNGAYAIHIDGGSVGGIVKVNNCNAFSYQSCGMGLGTIKNSEIVIQNCDIRSFTDSVTDYPNARVALSRGAIIYHTYASDGSGTEKITMKNNKVYSKNSGVVLNLVRSTDITKDATFVSNLLCGDNADSLVDGANTFSISNSYGNNATVLNN